MPNKLRYVEWGIETGRKGTINCLLHWSQKFSYSLDYQLWGPLMNFNWFIHKVQCQNVSTNNCNLQKREFCVGPLGCTSIRWTLSYPWNGGVDCITSWNLELSKTNLSYFSSNSYTHTQTRMKKPRTIMSAISAAAHFKHS